MTEAKTPPANGFVRVARKVYNPIGFSKGYNFILFFIFGGALFGFALARTMYLNVDDIFCGSKAGMNHALPGECYYYTIDIVENIGIRLHLYFIIPAAILGVFQFVPAIRYKAILFHRINGYVILLFVIIANAGALMIARHAFGGTMATQIFVGATVIMTTVGLAISYYNVKKLQIDQHRAWMLRSWFWLASIVTLRLIMIIAAQIIGAQGGYSFVQPCKKLNDIFDTPDMLTKLYPACAAFLDNTDLNVETIVKANFNGNVAELATAMNMCFGAAAWLALLLHAVGVEIYLNLTPRESQRLRDVSYQRQLEAGFKNPGNAGLTAWRLGDANDYVPPQKHNESFSEVALDESKK